MSVAILIGFLIVFEWISSCSSGDCLLFVEFLAVSGGLQGFGSSSRGLSVSISFWKSFCAILIFLDSMNGFKQIPRMNLKTGGFADPEQIFKC